MKGVWEDNWFLFSVYSQNLLIIIKIILNERIIGIELRYNNQLPVYIFCVYMPSDHDIVLDNKTLCDIQSI